jgi:predicted protein tyrosine phosphatase
VEFVVTDREGIEDGAIVMSSYVVISIHDPHKRRAKVRRQSGLRDVLFLAFHDAEPNDFTTMSSGVKAMTHKQAKQIWRFVDKHKAVAGTVVVHCEQGGSRSPAVAAGLCKAMGGKDQEFWQDYRPNHHVYRCILDAYEDERALTF